MAPYLGGNKGDSVIQTHVVVGIQQPPAVAVNANVNEYENERDILPSIVSAIFNQFENSFSSFRSMLSATICRLEFCAMFLI